MGRYLDASSEFPRFDKVNPTPLLYRSGSRLAGAYFSDSGCLLTATLNEDLGPCIIYAAIVASNAGGPDNIAVSNARWDDLIQFPVSVYRLAQDLGLPYETVRRYAAKLIARGLIERAREGLIARHEVLGEPAIAGMLTEFSGMTVKMHSSLQAMGANLTTQGKIVSPAHERRIIAMSIHYFLRGVKIATETLRVDPVPAMIHFTIHRANLAHLDPLPGSEVLDSAHVHLDAARKPVSVFAVARNLNLPYETARRHVSRLSKLDLVQRLGEEGFIVPSDLLKTEPFVNCVKDTIQATYDFMEAAFSPRLH